jgi:outer membrane murein-binding lipoprotein Lpp
MALLERCMSCFSLHETVPLCRCELSAKEDLVGAKKAVILGLAIVLVVMAFTVVACGSNEAAKATLRTALDKVQADIDALSTQFTAGGTVADVKAAKAKFEGDWTAVVTAAEGVKGADVQAAKDAWTTAATAIDNMDESQPLMQEGLKIMTQVQGLTKQVAELRKLVGDSTSK